MQGQYILSGLTLFGMFVLFLVLSRTLNSVVNQLLRLEYLVQKEYEFKKEEHDIRAALAGGETDAEEV